MNIEQNNEIYEQYTHPPGIMVSNYYNRQDDYFCYRINGTRDWHIIFTLSGRGTIQIQQKKHMCVEGDIIIFPPGIEQNYYTAPNYHWEKMWAHFFPRLTWMEWLKSLRQDQPIILKSISDKGTKKGVITAFNRLLNYNLDVLNSYREELALNALEEIILLIIKNNKNNQKKLTQPLFIGQIYARPASRRVDFMAAPPYSALRLFILNICYVLIWRPC